MKKRQYSICTIGYYDFVDYGYYDFVVDKINNLSQELNMTGEEIYSLVCCKLNPLQEKINQEYKDTEEYKCSMEVEEILRKYRKAKTEFEDKYGAGNFDYCYDVFLNLRNAENLKKIKQIYAKQDYFTGSYQRKNYSNYKDNSKKSSYQEKCGSNYKDSSMNNSDYGEDDKKILKKMYKTLARNFHPDKNHNSDESVRAMQIINDLKELWQL
ncbi:J domain-containing protein [Terrisporobacter glycolicus]|uniref:J domain-containing protein n=1 Tax=Terrisporobacter glycolicus TaxID=36841 RepID=UPI0012B5C046|nr:J domain-containing protein [Terrisporobacter glycolicus]